MVEKTGRLAVDINLVDINPFKISMAKTPAANKAPWVRNAFVPPAFLLPISRISIPLNFPSRILPDTEPKR